MNDVPGPTFLIIGAARSGTTLLSQLLGDRPEVWFTEPKEPHFLAFAGQTVDFTGPGDAETINRVAITRERDWRALFAPGSKQAVRGEGSVSTLYYWREAIPNIRTYCPDVKLVAILREPVDRAFSAWSYTVARGFEQESFERALELEEERIAAGYHHLWHYRKMSCYGEQLAAYLDAFGRERVLVIGYEDLTEHPETVLMTTHEFLGLPPPAEVDLGAPVNQSGQPRSRLVQRVGLWARQNDALRSAWHRMVPRQTRERIRSSNLRDVELDPDLRHSLDASFEEERRRVGELLGAEAPSWSRVPT